MKHNRIFLSVAMAAIMLVSICAVSASTLGVSAAQGSSSTPGVVGAPVAGAPAVCSQDGKGLDLFVRGADSALYWKHSAGGTTWSPSVDLGGVCTSNAAATSPANGVIDVFVRGSNGALYEDQTTNANAPTPTWTWTKIGGQLLAGTGPAAYHVDGALGWFVTGTNHALYQQWTEKGALVSWKNLGGYLTSAPAATVVPDGSQIGVIVAGTNSVLYYEHYSGGAWQPWFNIGAQLLAGTSPAAYNWGSARIGWFFTGTDYALHHMWSGATSGSENLGGYLTSSPGATSRSSGTIDVFARGGSGDFTILWQRSYSSGQWGDWTSIGGV
jgi:hypothetical protein